VKTGIGGKVEELRSYTPCPFGHPLLLEGNFGVKELKKTLLSPVSGGI